MNTLQIGDRFPQLTFDTVDGGTLRLPEDLAGLHGIILFYRGRW